jgi:hypothetical protein
MTIIEELKALTDRVSQLEADREHLERLYENRLEKLEKRLEHVENAIGAPLGDRA